jgi:hypothetical protein
MLIHIFSRLTMCFRLRVKSFFGLDLAKSGILIGLLGLIKSVLDIFAGTFLLRLLEWLFHASLPFTEGILQIILKNDLPTDVIVVVASVFLVCGAISVSKTSLN